MPHRTDRELVEAARGGDAESFGSLVRRHQKRIYRLAAHLLRSSAEAEDVTQETFVRAYGALARFDGRSEPFTWIYRICVNLSLNAIRARKTSRNSSPDDPRIEGLLIETRGSLADPAELTADRELALALVAGLDSLSETLRTTLILVGIDGLSHAEASEVLGCPEGTIAWRVHEARRKLRVFLEARGHGIEETEIMTEESDRDLLKRAETALSGMALQEPDWDGLASRIEGGVATLPAENTALFNAPLPRTDEDGSTDLEEPISVQPEMVRSAAPPPADVEETGPTSLDAFGDSLSTTESNDAGPSISVDAESEELDDGWSSAPDAADESAVAVASAAPPAGSIPPPGEQGRERLSLADLARATMARRGSSEAASIAKESLAVASQSRAQDAEVAQRVKAASLPPPAPKSVAPPAPSTRAAAPAPTARGSGDALKGPWIGVAIAGIGLAAAFALVLSRPDNQPVTIVQQAPVQPAVPQAEAPLPQAPVAKPEPPAAVPAPAPEAALDPTSLPKLPLEQAPRAEAKPDAAAAKASAAKATPAPTPAAPGKVAAEKIVLEEDHKGAPKAAPSAPRPGDGKLRPAELSTDNMTDRPSAGAAQAAVGAVLGAARACVAGHPQPSSAQLVFGSDGQVQSVTVGGPAAGTAAAGCIEGALKKARVQPFAASSFSLGVTVRPP